MSAPGKSRAGGVLPVNSAATKKPTRVTMPGNRAPGPKLRLIIRRLPPGLVESEFWAAIGDEWQVGNGKIEWAAFKNGKVSKDPAKPSRPARAYLKVKDQTQLDALSVKVKSTTFQDAKNSANDACLLGPPSLEFAPYNKMATTRIRHDGRQGTIDQDQEFINFLQSLTEPITKPATNGPDSTTNQPKITTTPLVQFLKEKKANKAKEAAEKKSAKQREVKDTKEKKSTTVVVKGSTSITEKARVAKATQDAVRAINKSVASMQTNKQQPNVSKPHAKDTSTKVPETPEASSRAPTTAGNRERNRAAAASAAAKILHRDLGLHPRSSIRAGRGSGEGAGTAQQISDLSTTPPHPGADTPSGDTKSTTTTKFLATPTGPRNRAVPTNINVPKAASYNIPEPPSSTTPAAAKPTKQPPNPSAGAKSAFLKHANPSQGVTEDLLRKTFEAFGTLTRCEIDKKKGLGYLDFDDTESLKKAMHASPVKVGNGQVVVLENRNVKRGHPANVQAASSPVVQSPVQKTATPVPTAPAALSKAPVSPAQTLATPTTQGTTTSSTPSAPDDLPISPTIATATLPPTAPKGNARGGGRGSIRGNPTQRGNFPAGARGNSPRGGGFRVGRGSFGPRGGRAAAQPVAAANSTSVGNSSPAIAAATAQTTGAGEVIGAGGGGVASG